MDITRALNTQQQFIVSRFGNEKQKPKIRHSSFQQKLNGNLISSEARCPQFRQHCSEAPLFLLL
jgi:hypothetical protein